MKVTIGQKDIKKPEVKYPYLCKTNAGTIMLCLKSDTLIVLKPVSSSWKPGELLRSTDTVGLAIHPVTEPVILEND